MPNLEESGKTGFLREGDLVRGCAVFNQNNQIADSTYFVIIMQQCMVCGKKAMLVDKYTDAQRKHPISMLKYKKVLLQA